MTAIRKQNSVTEMISDMDSFLPASYTLMLIILFMQ
jgi:hypothetical protein